MVRLHRHVIRLAERIREIILLVAVFGVVVFGVEQRPHPDAGLVSIYAFAKACRFNQDIDVAVSLNGVESGVTYRITLGLAQPGLAEDGYVVFQANSEFLPCCQDVFHDDSTGTMDLAFLIPAVQQGGYILTVAAHDRHPSLNEDETLLARREEPLACKESQQGEDSNGVDTKAQQQQPDSKVASHDEKQQDMEGDFLSEIARLPRWDEAGEEA
eukprot:2499512-Rhodomonas_salina.1